MNAGESQSTTRLERALQESLQPVDPGTQFTAALQARLAAAGLHPSAAAATPYPAGGSGLPYQRLYRAAMPLAAALVIALAVGWQLLDLREARLAAQARIHAQVLLALEITGERLGLAQQRIEQFQNQEH